MVRKRVVLILGLILAFWGCSSDSQHLPADVGISTADATGDSDAGVSQESDPQDASNRPNEDSGSQAKWLVAESTSPWTKERRCSGRVAIPPPSVESFQVPDLPKPPPAKRTIDDLAEELDGNIPPKLNGLVVDPKHEPGPFWLYDVYVEPGEPLTVEVYLTTDLDSSTGSTPFRATLTFMLDNEPVELNYKRWSADRTTLIEEVNASGFAFEPHEFLSIVDVTIPAEELEAGKMHELAFTLHNGQVDGGYHLSTRRIPIFNGGYEPAVTELPCAIPPIQEPTTEFERELIKQRGFAVVLLFTNPAPDARIVQKASPGETVRIFYSVLAISQIAGPHNVAITPTLDGVPVGETQWVQHSGPGAKLDRSAVDARGYFDITLPEEPGLYLVGATAIEDPFVRWRELGTLEPRRGFPEVRNAESTSATLPRWFEVRE